VIPQISRESEMIFDRTAGGHRFDFTRGVCFVCGISREEFKDNSYPRCTGEPYGKGETSPTPPGGDLPQPA
jgi:hypothetical protein